MAYTNEQQAFHLLTSATFGGSTLKGILGIRMSKRVVRNPIRADGSLGPVARPVQQLDAMAVVRMLDGNSVQAHTAAAATLTANMKKCDGTTGSANITYMLPSDVDLEAESGEGGFAMQQLFEVETGTPALSFTQ